MTEELGIATYTRLAIGGGGCTLGTGGSMSESSTAMWEQVRFFVKVGNLRQVIIINHEDCLWYRHVCGHHPTIEIPIQQKLDLQHAAMRILEDFPGVQVRVYMAKIEGEQVRFAKVD